MSALKKLWQWLRSKTRPPEAGPDGNDLQLPAKTHAATDFNQGMLHYDVERQLRIASRETRQQQNWRSRAGPWQQK
jgi:hypothetical protein